MSDLYGYNFSPDLANKFRSSLNNPSGASQLGPQVGQALRVISLHLPEFTGGAPIAPDGLLRPSHSFTPDAAVRAQTTGAGPGAQPPQQITTGPFTTQPQPRIPFGGSAPDSGPGAPSTQALPTISFGDPSGGAPPAAPSAPPVASGDGMPVGGGIDRQNGLSGLLDAFLRVRGGGF